MNHERYVIFYGFFGFVWAGQRKAKFPVLSNCQRHVKLCQKRSAKVLNPSEEESTNDSAANGAPFIQFSNDPANASQSTPVAEPAARRSHEIPIRPKLASRGSGSTNSSVGGSTAAAEARQRHKTRSGSSSSAGSLAPKSEPSSMPPSLERRGSGSAVPVVPSSPAYPQGSYPASSGYSQPSTYGSYGQSGYDLTGPTYNAYGGGYGGSSSRYDQVATGFEPTSATHGFEQARAAAYDSLNPSFSTTSSGYDRSVPAYGGSSPSFDHPESGFNHQYPAAVGTPHVGSLPSPSHVQSTPHSVASPTAAAHEAGSYFATTPGVYAAPSARRPSVTSSVTSRRSTITHSLVQHDQIGFHEARVADTPNMGPTNDAAGPPVTASGSYYSPSSGLVAVPYETQSMKQEEAVPDLAHRVWPKEPTPYQTGYSEPQWTPAVGAEPSSFHAYHTGSSSSADLTGPHDNHVASAPTGYAVYPQQQPQQPQSRQQLYHQHAQGGYSNSPGQQQQQAQQHDAYSNDAYAHRSTAYGINSGVVSVPRQSHQDSSNYSWPGSEAAWNTQHGYHS
ncbi:unnamed protein product [Rhizoctonia solani]|uniref:Uncharacterized protein n=1 Tax=Rhizoctonia solani TaxID=456999 RepID=A0A8H3A028_9AGAM|nr:unnamed protein product [Rhizoctonia solani]